jgi:hypothetical protein
MDLEHNYPECTGRLEHCGSHWHCDGCGAVAYHCSDVAAAAVREETLGRVLHQLVEEGGQ